MSGRLTRAKTPSGQRAVALALKGKPTVVDQGLLKSAGDSTSGGVDGDDGVAGAPASRVRAGSAAPASSRSSASVPGGSAATSGRRVRARSAAAARAPQDEQPPSSPENDEPALESLSGKTPRRTQETAEDGGAIDGTVIGTAPPVARSRSPEVHDSEDDDEKEALRRPKLPPGSSRILERVDEEDEPGLEIGSTSRRPRPRSRSPDAASGQNTSSQTRKPLFDPGLATSSDEDVPAGRPFGRRTLEDLLGEPKPKPLGRPTIKIPPYTRKAPVPPPSPTPAPASATAAASTLVPPPSPTPAPVPDVDGLPLLTEITGDADETPLPGAESKAVKPTSLEDFLGHEDEDDDYDGLDQQPGDAGTKKSYARGPLPKEDMDTVLALVAAFDEGLVNVARKTNKPLSYIYRLAMPHLKLSRKPNLFNLYVKRWCYKNKKEPDETFPELRDRFLAAYRKEVGSMTPEAKAALRKELITWNETYEQMHAKRVQQDGDLYKIMLQARMEFEVLAQYYYRFYDIAAFGWVVSIHPGDSTAMQANSTFASTTAAVKFMDQMGSHVPQAMDQFASVVKIHKASEISMNDWSENKQLAVIRAGGDAVKSRFTRFLIDLQNRASGRNVGHADWKFFGMQLVNNRKVITKWMPGVATPDAKKTILNRMDTLKKFMPYIFQIMRHEVDDRYHTDVRDMTLEEKSYADNKATRKNWLDVPIIEDWDRNALVTVRDALRIGTRSGGSELVASDDQFSDDEHTRPISDDEHARPKKKAKASHSDGKERQREKEEQREKKALAKEKAQREKEKQKARNKLARALTQPASSSSRHGQSDRAASVRPQQPVKPKPPYVEVDGSEGGSARKRKRAPSATAADEDDRSVLSRGRARSPSRREDSPARESRGRGRSRSRRKDSPARDRRSPRRRLHSSPSRSSRSHSSGRASSRERKLTPRLTRSRSRSHTAAPAHQVQIGGGNGSSLANALGDYEGHGDDSSAPVLPGTQRFSGGVENELWLGPPVVQQLPAAFTSDDQRFSQAPSSYPASAYATSYPSLYGATANGTTFWDGLFEQQSDQHSTQGQLGLQASLQPTAGLAGANTTRGAIAGTSMDVAPTPQAAPYFTPSSSATYADAAQPASSGLAASMPSQEQLQQQILHMQQQLAGMQMLVQGVPGRTMQQPTAPQQQQQQYGNAHNVGNGSAWSGGMPQ